MSQIKCLHAALAPQEREDIVNGMRAVRSYLSNTLDASLLSLLQLEGQQGDLARGNHTQQNSDKEELLDKALAPRNKKILHGTKAPYSTRQRATCMNCKFLIRKQQPKRIYMWFSAQ